MKRYRQSCDWNNEELFMEEDENGEFVRYEDVAPIINELEEYKILYGDGTEPHPQDPPPPPTDEVEPVDPDWNRRSEEPTQKDDGKYKQKIVTEMQIWDELNKLINLPKHCTRAAIIIEKGCLVTVECTVIGQKGTGEPISRCFKLVELEEITKEIKS